jgi:hypothetical protein
MYPETYLSSMAGACPVRRGEYTIKRPADLSSDATGVISRGYQLLVGVRPEMINVSVPAESPVHLSSDPNPSPPQAVGHYICTTL